MRFVLLIASMTIPALGGAHPFHVSLAEVEFNPESKKLEVALRLYGVDTETALSRLAKKRIDLDDEADRDRFMKQYLASHFRVAPVGKQKTRPKNDERKESRPAMGYVGSEVVGAHVWAYFELAVPAARQPFTLHNSVLTEIQHDQQNTVSLRIPAGRQTLNFNHKVRSRRVSVKTILRQPDARVRKPRPESRTIGK